MAAKITHCWLLAPNGHWTHIQSGSPSNAHHKYAVADILTHTEDIASDRGEGRDEENGLIPLLRRLAIILYAIPWVWNRGRAEFLWKWAECGCVNIFESDKSHFWHFAGSQGFDLCSSTPIFSTPVYNLSMPCTQTQSEKESNIKCKYAIRLCLHLLPSCKYISIAYFGWNTLRDQIISACVCVCAMMPIDNRRENQFNGSFVNWLIRAHANTFSGSVCVYVCARGKWQFWIVMDALSKVE